VYGLSNSPFIVSDYTTSSGHPGRKLEFDVPTKAIRQYRKFTIQPILFKRSLAQSYEPSMPWDFHVDQVKVLALDDGNGHTRMAFLGDGFDGSGSVGEVGVIINGKPASRVRDGILVSTKRYLIVQVDRADLDRANVAFLTRTGGYPLMVSLSDKPAPPKVTISDIDAQKVKDDPIIEIKGENLDQVVEVWCNGDKATWDPTTHKVSLTSRMLDAAGTRKLIFKLRGGEQIVSKFEVKA
jgi:hypothetical protein